MSGKLSSLLSPLRALPRLRRTRRTRSSSPAAGTRSSLRRCRLETLEQRTLLSVSDPGGVLSPSWNPRVDLAWFARLDATPVGEPSGAVSLLDGHPSPTQTAGAGGTVDAAAGRWVVQLTEEATRKAGSVAGTVGYFDAEPFAAQVIRGLGLQGMVLIAAEPGAGVTTVDAWLRDNPHVAYHEPDSVLATRLVPDDVEFSSLWGLHNTGQTGGTPDADIDAPEAWDLVTGDGSVVVGIIDTGVDHGHPDLAANIWTNPGEVPGNGIDDDGNGFIDDVHGYDFANSDGDPMDDNGHGTHVAGTIAGVGNNREGVAGVNWNGSVMALKFLDAEGNGFTSAAVEAVNYATMMSTLYGVDLRVTNNSWGGSGLSQALYDAVEASGRAGILFVAAAGNDAGDNDVLPHYPSSYDLPNVLAVAATDHNDELADFSNYGAASVDLGAPGTAIYSTLPGGRYGSYGGSSMAAPHVAGVAALAWASAPHATMEQVRDAILAGVDVVASLDGVVATGGRLNAFGTLEQLSMGVLSSNPDAGSIVAAPPLDFPVRFTHPYDALSVDAADLTVNGAAADRLVPVDDRAVIFQFDVSPVVAEGPQTMEIAAGAVLRAADGDPIDRWQATFYYDLLPLAVTATTPAESAILAAAPVQILLHFNEPVDPSSVDVADLSLNMGAVASAIAVDVDTVGYVVDGLPREGTVTYTLAGGAVRDAHGTPGPAYVGRFAIDDPLIERYASADVPKSITDYTTITSTLRVEESFAVADLDLELEIAHAFDADLDVSLVGPDGTTILLFSAVGGAGRDFSGTVLDDEAATAIGDGAPPFTGRYRPVQPLSTFDGLDVLGTWTLKIGDSGGWDQGALLGWAMLVQRGPELPPRIRSVDPLPPDGQAAWGAVSTLDVHFSKQMDPAGVNAVANWQLLEAGPDGRFDTADDVVYPLSLPSPYSAGTSVTLASGVGRLPEGAYRFRARAAGLADPSGTPLDGNGDGVAGDDYRTHFNVLPHNWYLSGDVPKEIIDRGTVTSTIEIEESFPIADVDVHIGITHSYDADLDVYLITPNGTRIELFTDVGGSNGQDFSGTVLDDEADTAIVDGRAPFSGRYRPQQPLAAADGWDAQGIWTLEITDDLLQDTGTLNSWAIIVERGADVPPEITSVDPLPDEGGTLWGPLDRFQVHFSEPMDPATVNGGAWRLLHAGADGLFETIDDVGYSLTVAELDVGGLAATLVVDVGYLPAGSYRLTASSGDLTDRYGTFLDGNGDGTPGDDYATRFTLLSSNRYASGDVPKSVPDLTTITSTLFVGHAFSIADVDVQVDIAHTYTSDLDVYLVAPDGTRVELFTDVGGSGDNFLGTILDDEAAEPIIAGAAPFNDRYRPKGELSVLDGLNARGTWTLEITDDSLRDAGTLNGWALIIQPEAAIPPRVAGHQPGGVEPGPVDSIQIKFDRPMNPLSFAAADDVVSFAGPQGPIAVSDSAWLDPQSLEINFAPQSAPGAYTLVLAPSVLSKSGAALDQDGDSRPGEIPDDRYAAGFTIADALGTLTFAERSHLDLSAGDAWLYFETSRQGVLTLQANYQVGEGSVDLTLYDENLNALSMGIDTPTYGNRRIDRNVLAAQAYYLKLSGTHADVHLRLANLLTSQGGTVTVHGTGGDDHFEFEAATHNLIVNEVGYEFDPASAGAVVFLGDGGDDTVILRGNAGSDDLWLWPNRGKLVGDNFRVTVAGVERINVHGGGGTDVARLFDHPATPDTLEASPDSARFHGLAFDHQVFSYSYVHAFATEGDGDVARLYGRLGGEDTLEATPGSTRLYGERFFNRAIDFDQVLSYGNHGDVDVALLYDDPLAADVFDATPEVASMVGAGFDNQAHGFRYVHGFATQGSGDVARLHDDPVARDYYKAVPRQARLYADGFFNRAVRFDQVLAYGTPASGDVALLYDDPGRPDNLSATPDSVAYTGLGFDNQAHHFRYVHAYATPGDNDVAELHGDPSGPDLYKATPRHARLYADTYFQRVLTFDHVLAYGSSDHADVAFLYDDPGGKDVFDATPEVASIVGAGFDNQAHGFPYVHAYSTRGSGDEARLHDDPLRQDTFKATPDQAVLDGAGFFNRALAFDTVYAYGTPSSGDVALFYDNPLGKDAFEATPDYARLSGNGFWNQADGFRYVHAYATPGEDDEAHLYDSRGDDTFKAAPDYGKLYGGDFFLRAMLFDTVKAYASNGGNDTAYLFDSALDDLLEARDDWASLTNGVLDFANWAIGFERVEATASNDGDRKDVDAAVNFLYTYGPW